MPMPLDYTAHLDPHFPDWLQLIDKLMQRSESDDRFVILPTDTPTPRLREIVKAATVLRADLNEEGEHSLLIIYQDKRREHDRFIMLASRRFMLEVSVGADSVLLDVRLVIFDSERDGMPYPLLPWGGRVDAMVEYLWRGGEIAVVEIE